MELVRIHKLDARYRLPRRAFDERRRLDRVLHQVLDEGLELAARAAGVAPDEELCVRRAAVDVRVRLSGPDAVMVSDWSRALAAELSRLITTGRSDAVARYRSRAHALDELVDATARGDSRRAWAWRQLGLPVGGRAGAAIVRALAERPESIVVVLRERARAGGFAALESALTVEDWQALADRALAHTGAASLRAWIAAPRPRGVERPAPPLASDAPRALSDVGAAPGVELERQVERVRRGSLLLQAAAARATAIDIEARPALAALALLDGEPALARSDDAVALAAAVERALAPRSIAPTPAPRKVTTRDDRELAPSRAPDAPAPPPAGAPRAVEPASPHADDRSAPHADDRDVTDLPARAKTRAADAGDAAAPSVETAPAAAPLEVGDAAASPPPAGDQQAATEPFARLRGSTRAGGLLFLVHVVAELGVPDSALADRALATRGLRWILHRLALRLAALGPTDPAALAFAGLPPTRELPAELDGDPLPDEAAALDAIAARVGAALAARLGEPDADLAATAALVAATCARRAGIVADPGWIEVHLSLDEVTVPVRRAGLDLDPGFVPWLGVVLRFVYGA